MCGFLYGATVGIDEGNAGAGVLLSNMMRHRGEPKTYFL
jgi:hypothetical protein